MTGASDQLAIWFSCATAGINFVFSLVGLKLIHLLSRRKLLLGSLGGVTLSLLCISTSFAVLENSSVHHNGTERFMKRDTDEFNIGVTSSLSGEVLVLISLAIYIAAFAPGLGPLPWTINSELHPSWCRAQAQGLATSVNWVANLVVSMTFLSLVSAIGRPLTFLLYAIVTFSCTVILAYFLPETKNVNLESISDLFSPSASTPKSGDVHYTMMQSPSQDHQ
eukprot:TRINITY_DN13980_c0_g1_i4.p1 TRINITY_DN13980_c0_g1~~TRINITY_DN13980_c0_g1_i4.p1  ORF type:complete len:249 (-),score=-7.41 TRINITY_DN13980_c0_g1_i4:145-810(-)